MLLHQTVVPHILWLAMLVAMGTSQAPGDEDMECSPFTPNVLIDSNSYVDLTSIWTVTDEPAPGDGNTWVQSSDVMCDNEYEYCGTANTDEMDLLITQTINSTTAENAQLTYTLDYTTFDCPETSGSNDFIRILICPTSSLDCTDVIDMIDMPITCDNSSSLLSEPRPTPPAGTFNIRIFGNFSDGVCARVTSLRVTFAPPCSETTNGLATYPMTNSSLTATGTCVDNAEAVGGATLEAVCNNGVFDFSSAGECQCSAGYELNGQMCTACGAGSFKSSVGNGACTPCPANSTATGTGSTFCECDIGHVTNTGMNTTTTLACDSCTLDYFPMSAPCDVCPANSRRQVQTDTQCTCFGDTTTAGGATMTTSEPCEGCSAGFYRNNNMCMACPANSNTSSGVQASCNCVTGRVTSSGESQTMNDDCDSCAENYFLSGGNCVQCPLQSSSPPTNMDSSCTCNVNAGRVTNTGMTTTTGLACDSCPQDFFFLDSGNCEPCPPQSSTSGVSMNSSCTCNTGHVLNTGMTTTSDLGCGSCAENYFLRDENCVQCPLQSSSPPTNTASSCTCNTGYTSSAGTTTSGPDCDTCAADYFQTSVGAVCMMCPDNSNRETGSASTMCPCIMGFSRRDTTDNNAGCIATVSFAQTALTFSESESQEVQVDISAADNVTVTVTPAPTDLIVDPMSLMFTSGGPTSRTLTLSLADTVALEENRTFTVTLDSDSDVLFENQTLTVTVTVEEEEEEEEDSSDEFPIAGVAGAVVGGVVFAILLVAICIICVLIFRFRVNRRGFYPTYEDKASPPTMLRYSASLRSISSQTVMPVDGKPVTKENEFYV